jgi:PAS domain S-box-containing protein
MNASDLQRQLAEAQKTIRELQQELEETNKGLIALTLELEESKERFRSIFENAGEAIITLDKADIVQAWNLAAKEMFGYKAEEIIGHLFHYIVPEELRKKGEPEQLRKKTEDVGKIGNYETQRIRKDGAKVEVALTRSTLRDSEGNITGFVDMLTDITERKKTEAILAQQALAVAHANTELVAVNKELEAFSYSVSHDLRSPLRSIDGFSQALLEDYAGKLDKEGENYLHRVRAAAQRMGELIDDLLALSRVTRREMRHGMVNLSALAGIVAIELQQGQPERGGEFAIAEGVTVNGDETLLRLVLENLLGNAWKFTSKQPKARIEFGVTQYDGKPAYYVRDDGVGFDMAHVGKLFAPFQRLHSADEFSGTGIGLATVQRIIKRHGGRVWAEGAVERGATFYFTLPNSATKGEV